MRALPSIGRSRAARADATAVTPAALARYPSGADGGDHPAGGRRVHLDTLPRTIGPRGLSMRTFLLALVLVSGALLAAFVYQQLIVEGSLGPAGMLGILALGAGFLAAVAMLRLHGTRHRDLVTKVLIAAMSTVATYLVADVLVGAVLIKPLSPPLVPDAYRHHKLVPNSLAEFKSPDYHYVQRVNALGLRGPEIAVQKPAGTYRIVMLGDSFTMGKGVEDDQTFSALLERALRVRFTPCGGPLIEVINAGVDSYAPVLSLIHLKRELQALSPDLVIENLDVSDLVQESAYRSQGVRGEDGEIVAVPQLEYRQSTYEKVRSWTERNLFFTRVLLLQVNRALGYRDVSVRNVVMHADAEVVAHTLQGHVGQPSQWDDQFDSLIRMKRHAEASGMDFLLSLYPWAHQVSDSQWVPGRWAFMPRDAKPSDVRRATVTERAAAAGIPLVDLFPQFEARVSHEQLYFDIDMHFTVAGHRAMAVGLEEHLAASYGDRWCAPVGR